MTMRAMCTVIVLIVTSFFPLLVALRSKSFNIIQKINIFLIFAMYILWCYLFCCAEDACKINKNFHFLIWKYLLLQQLVLVLCSVYSIPMMRAVEPLFLALKCSFTFFFCFFFSWFILQYNRSFRWAKAKHVLIINFWIDEKNGSTRHTWHSLIK